MLFTEFLEGTGTTENLWSHSEYKRIEAIYMESENMTKEDAYKLYREPDRLTQIMLDTISDYKSEYISTKAERDANKKEIEKLRKELGEARQEILKLESQVMTYERAAHNLFYATGTI